MAANAKTKKVLNSDLYREIRQDLLDQLDRNGTFGKYFEDLVNDYMDIWTTKCLLVEDIQHRGVLIKYDNGGGQKGYRKNDSIEQRIKVNAQMLKLLAELDIRPAQRFGTTPDDSSDGEDGEL